MAVLVPFLRASVDRPGNRLTGRQIPAYSHATYTNALGGCGLECAMGSDLRTHGTALHAFPAADPESFVPPPLNRRHAKSWRESVEKIRADRERRAARYARRKTLKDRQQQLWEYWAWGYGESTICRRMNLTPRQARRGFARCEADWRLAFDDPRAFSVHERVRLIAMNQRFMAAVMPTALREMGDDTDRNTETQRAQVLLWKLMQSRTTLTGAEAPRVAAIEHSGPAGGPIPVKAETRDNIRDALYRLVESHPEARDAVVSALLVVEGQPAGEANGSQTSTTIAAP